MRQIGWLNAIPEKKSVTRREEYTEGSPYLDFPPLSHYEEQLFNYWIEVGQVSQTSNGPIPITWAEIDAWAKRFHTEQYVEWVEQPPVLRADGMPDKRCKTNVIPLRATQCTLLDWELQMIRRMSQEYVYEVSNKDPSRPCPREVVIEDMDEDAVMTNAISVGATLKSLFSNDAHAPPAVEAVINNT